MSNAIATLFFDAIVVKIMITLKSSRMRNPTYMGRLRPNFDLDASGEAIYLLKVLKDLNPDLAKSFIKSFLVMNKLNVYSYAGMLRLPD